MRERKLIQMYITNNCNSRCKTCGIWRDRDVLQELNDICISRVVSAFPDADYVIGGGEAILHSNIEIILDYLSFCGVNYTLLSNGILLDKLEYLVDKYCVPAVTVSYDGINHDEIRGGVKGNLVSIVNFKKWCDSHNVPIKLSYTYSKYNEGNFEKDMEFAREQFGVDSVYFCLAQDMDLLMTSEADENFVADDFEKILKSDMVLDKDKYHIKGMISGVRRPCTSQSNVHTIYSNGDIVRCQSYRSNEVLGNVRNMTIRQISMVLSNTLNTECSYDSECNLLCQRRYD